MKIQTRQINAFLEAEKRDYAIALFFGPEEGLVSERGLKLALKISPDLKDAFSVVNLSVSNITEQPSLIHDEMASGNLMRTPKLIRIKHANDKIFSALDIFLKANLETDNFLLIEAGDLDKKSKLRNIAEKSDKIAAIACYEEDPSQLIMYIRQKFSQEGFECSQDALIALSTSLSNHRLLLNSEIEKLILFKQADKKVTLEDVKQTLSSHGESFHDEPAWAAANGDHLKTDRILGQLLSQSIAPISILRAAQNHFNKLLIVKEQLEQNIPLEKALFSVKPPLFFKVKPIFINQIQGWNIRSIKRVLTFLQTAEKECKSSLISPETNLSRCFYKISAMAEHKNKYRKPA